MIAVLVALIGVFSIGSLIFQATVTNKNQGTEVTRATIYAQDKIEKLLSLDLTSNPPLPADANSCNQTTQPASCNTTGITGTGWTQGLLAGGAIAPMQTTCPTSGASVGYVDYLNTNGTQLTGTCSALTSTDGNTSPAYIRMWQIQDVCTAASTPTGCIGSTPTGGPTMKQITVAVWSLAAIGQAGQLKPVVTLTCYLSNPNYN